MQTIQAKVNDRLLKKASRLFTGTLKGRVIEILQNARRAGATQIEITNQDGQVTVRDNGHGIDDFERLLDLGGSGWEEALECSEDPAGVGLFCLAPRELTIRSNGKKAIVQKGGWTGEPVEIRDDPESIHGTLLQFQDEPWNMAAVELSAVFLGLTVKVDGEHCPQAAFVSDKAIAHPELGCRIEVREVSDLEPWHNSSRRGSYYSDNVLVNFHGQVVSFDHHPVSEHQLHFLVDLTGEPTGIRLMLPARTRLVENDALTALKAAMELEAFKYLHRRGRHHLIYKEYVRAHELGVTLSEAEPTYRVGLLIGDTPEPIAVNMPEGFPLAKCYRFDMNAKDGTEADEANVHLLAALGTFKEPFVPVEIKPCYDGYSWAKLPTIGKVTVKIGKKLQESYVWSGRITCVDQLMITAQTSDGAIWSSEVCMAVLPPKKKDDTWCSEDHVYLTAAAHDRLSFEQVWYHLGGWNDEGDLYDTQLSDFTQQLEDFWLRLVGPDEQLRVRLFGCMDGTKANWKSITLKSDGSLTIQSKKGTKRTVKAPKR